MSAVATTAPAPAPARAGSPGFRFAGLLPLTRNLTINILAPWLAYAALERWLPAPGIVPLLAAAAIPAVESAVLFARKRAIDAIAIISVTQYVVSVLITLATRDPHAAMVGHALQPAALGLVFGLSTLVRRPLTIPLARQIMAGGDPQRQARFDAVTLRPAARLQFAVVAWFWTLGLGAETAIRLMAVSHLSTRDYLLLANTLGYAIPSLLAWSSLRYGDRVGRRLRG